MNHRRDPLDTALASLPESLTPPRDLWADIRARIELEESAAGGSGGSFRGWMGQWRQLAASLVLAAAASALTYVLTRQAEQNETPVVYEPTPAPIVSAMPASFGGENLSADYFKARAGLDAEFERRIATLPPATRAKLENDLADLRRAANEIAATLAEHPSDPLLQDLLMSTYRSELRLFADVNAMTTRTLRTDL